MLNKDNLIQYFSDGIKLKGSEKIGTEHEKFIYSKKDLSLIPFHGERSISAVLKKFIENSWDPIIEDEQIVGANKNQASITLEPGGQFELSGAPLNNLHETCREINDHLSFTKSLEEEFDIGFLGIGYIPLGTFNDMPKVPKKRYQQIMTPYMKKIGGLGLEMMYQTCTVQANFDFTSESDMAKKVNVSAALQPLATALFANSPFKNGNINGYLSYRSIIWDNTDKDRTGILPGMLDKNFSFEQYVDYLLNVPVYFLSRNNSYIDTTEYTFKELLDGKNKDINSDEITILDWETHVSTIFTEVRLKTYIEMRGADAGSYKSLCALPAMWTGILYDDETLDAANDIVKNWSLNDILNFKIDSAKSGLKTSINNRTGWTIANELLEISMHGLEKRKQFNYSGESESQFLGYLFNIVNNKEVMASKIINSFQEEWNKDFNNLYSELSF